MDKIGTFTALGSAILMGTIGVFSKTMGVSPEVVTFGRLFFGTFFMLLFLIYIKDLKRVTIVPTFPVIASGTMLAGFIIFYVQAMNLTTMANAIMLVYLAPVAASIIAHFFFKEHLNRTSALLICLALFGFAMMMEFEVDFKGGGDEIKGIGFGLLSMCAYAAFILINRTINDQVHVHSRAFYQLLAGSCVALPFAFGELTDISAINWILLGCVGLFPGFLAILCAVIALSRLPAAVFGTLAYIEPVAVILFGWVFFAESLGPLQVGGCFLIIVSGIAQAFTGAIKRNSYPSEGTE